MFDIGDKNELIRIMEKHIEESWATNSGYSSSNQIESNISNIAHNIAIRVAKDISKQTIAHLIKHLYTCSEFEKDLGIRS